MNLVPAANGYVCTTDPGEPGLNVPRWSVSDGEARFVAELCKGLDVLEIGTGLGVSTRAIAKLAHWVHTVDVDPWVKENVELPDNCTFYSDIEDVPEGLGASFIDGRHSKSYCLKDIKSSQRIVKEGGLFIFHDAKMDAVRAAVIESGISECFLVLTPAGLVVGWND